MSYFRAFVSLIYLLVRFVSCLAFIVWVNCRFASFFLTFQLLPANLVFLPTHDFERYAIYFSFLSTNCNLNILNFSDNLPQVHYLRNGPALAFL